MRRALTRPPLPPPGELGQAKVTLSPWRELERERERERKPWNRGSGLQRGVVVRRHS